MKKSFLTTDDYFIFNNLKLDDNISQTVDLIDISNNIFNSIENKFNEKNINEDEIIDLFKTKLEIIKMKKYQYYAFLKVVYFYYNLYNNINKDANSKFLEIDKLRKLNEYEYKIRFLNFTLNNETESKENNYFKKNIFDNSFDEKFEDESINANSISLNEKSEDKQVININSDKRCEKIISNDTNRNFLKKDSFKFLKRKRKIKTEENNKNNFLKYDENLINNLKKKTHNFNYSNPLCEEKYFSDELNTRGISIKNKSEYYHREFQNNQNNISIKSENNVSKNNFTSLIKKNEYTEKKPSGIIINRMSIDEDFKGFVKNLNNYLKRIFEERRKKEFLKSILPESKNFVEKLFSKDNNILLNKKIPIYRNDYLEYSLIIEEGGKITKKILYSKY